MDEESKDTNHKNDDEACKGVTEIEKEQASNSLDNKELDMNEGDAGDNHVKENDTDNHVQESSDKQEQGHDVEGLDDGPNEFEQHNGQAEKVVQGGPEVDKKDETKKKDEKESANKDWVAIVEADEGKLYTELQKIGKLISRQQKVSEIKCRAKKHRMRVFPVTLDELNTPYMRSVLEMCSQVHMKWVTKRTDDGVILNGILEMTFAKLKDAEEQKKKLKEFKKGISVWDNYDNTHEEETNRKFNKMAGIPVDADANNKLTLLTPSLPTSVTEDELWQLFPNAREIWLITGGKRHHAYLKFLDEETLQKTLAKLQEQGPPREDFNFCRLVRYYEVEHAIKYTRSGASQRSDHHRSGSPPRHHHSGLSHSHSSKSETSDKKKPDHKSKSSSGDADKSSSKSEAKSDALKADKSQSFTSSAFDTNGKKMDSEGATLEKSTLVDDGLKSNKKDSKSDNSESKSDDVDSKSKLAEAKSAGKDSESDRPDLRPTKRKNSDHSKSSRSLSETKSLSRSSASRRHRSRDRSVSRSRSRGRSDHLHRFDTRRHPAQKKIIAPLRKRERSPRRMNHSSLLGPPPGPVPSLLAAGPLQNSSMMMGRPLENALSQLQRPSIQQPVMAPQVQNQQGMHVLDNLLSTIGQFSNQPTNMPSMMYGEDSYRKRPVLHRRSRSRSPLGRGCSPLMTYDEPNKRLHVMNNVRDKAYPQDNFSGPPQDNYTRGGSGSFRTRDFERNDDYLNPSHHDDYSGYNQQFNQASATARSYDAGHMTTQRPSRDMYEDQRSFPAQDVVRMGRPIETVRPSDLNQVKKDTATLEGEYALMMNQLGQLQQRGPMSSAYRPDYY